MYVHVLLKRPTHWHGGFSSMMMCSLQIQTFSAKHSNSSTNISSTTHDDGGIGDDTDNEGYDDHNDDGGTTTV